MAAQCPTYITDVILTSGVCGEVVENAFIMLKDLVESARQKSGVQQRAIFYVVKDANVARLRQAYIATNSDIEAKVIWRTTDPDTYSIHRWMTVLLWFDVVVLTEEILINLLKHPLLDFRVQFLLIADDCSHHNMDEHCYDSIYSHFTECTQDSTYMHIASQKSAWDFEMRRRPARHALGWYHATVNPYSDIQDDDETWRWCGVMPEDQVINLGNWIFDAPDGDYESLMLLEQHQNDMTYKVRSSGAILTLWSAPSILYMYCASLSVPETDISQSLPVFEMVESSPPYRLNCWLTLPQTSPVREMSSSIFKTRNLGVRHAAFKACKLLHQNGYLDDMFLPRTIREVEIIEIEDDLIQEYGLEQPLGRVKTLIVSQRSTEEHRSAITEHIAGIEVGRAFIRMLLAVDHFIRYPMYNEGQLTRYRDHEIAQIRNRHQAYVVVGDSYLSEGIEKALSNAFEVLEPMDGIRHWTDFAESFRRRRTTHTGSMSFPGMPDLMAVERILGYVFKDKLLLLEALSERTTPAVPSYQRLEYLGDAILELVAVVFWAVQFPKSSGYMINVLKAESVSNKALQVVCLENSLDQHIWNLSTEQGLRIAQARKSVHQAKMNRPNTTYWRKTYLCKTLADIVESILGAVFLDCGLNIAVVTQLLERIQWPIIGMPLIVMG
ncbi:Dicer-like protein 2, partial [Mortierella sp. NVP85]